MSFSQVSSACVYNSQVIPVLVEIDLQPGLPLFNIIGLPDKQIFEAKERIRSALKNSGFGFPLGKITVNLSPSDVPKAGTGLDLAIAVGIQIAERKLPPIPLDVWVLGELSLDGYLRPIKHCSAILIEADHLKKRGCLLPERNTETAELKTKYLKAGDYSEVVELLKNRPLKFIEPKSVEAYKPDKNNEDGFLIDQIKGQGAAKRVLEISLAGGHNLIFSGPPGIGKTMLVKSSVELLPELNDEEYLEVSKIYSLSDEKFSLSRRPPFRSPHHTISQAGLFGGGAVIKPGEMSLAHKGIIFLDELPEFARSVREALRQPLQDRKIQLNRQMQEYIFPADCVVITSYNLCPCGLSGIEGRSCHCKMSDLLRYQSALSEPLLDRFDLYLLLSQLEQVDYQEKGKSLIGQKYTENIKIARKVQQERQNGKLNSLLLGNGLKKFAKLSKDAHELLMKAIQSLRLSTRSVDKISRVSRTIADLDHKADVELKHLQEALQYRLRPTLD